MNPEDIVLLIAVIAAAALIVNLGTQSQHHYSDRHEPQIEWVYEQKWLEVYKDGAVVLSQACNYEPIFVRDGDGGYFIFDGKIVWV